MARGTRRRARSTREALIRAGRRLFTRYGYDGASVRAIARAARANLGSVTYHFGSKRKLYGAVVSEALAPLADRIVAAAASSGDPLDRAGAVVRAYVEFLGEDPDPPRLLLQELAVGRPPPPEAVAVLQRILNVLRGLVEEGQAAGRIREGEASLFALSIVAQPLQVAIAWPLYLKLVGVDPRDPAVREWIARHAARFVRAGLARGGGGAAEGDAAPEAGAPRPRGPRGPGGRRRQASKARLRAKVREESL